MLRFNLIKNYLDLLNLFIENTADTCDDSCLNGLSECITCLQVRRPCFFSGYIFIIKDTMVNYMTEDMYSVLCESGKYLKYYFILNFEFFAKLIKNMKTQIHHRSRAL